jgi:hypothetical protein
MRLRNEFLQCVKLKRVVNFNRAVARVCLGRRMEATTQCIQARETQDKGLISVLKQIHDDLDYAVLEAFIRGWCFQNQVALAGFATFCSNPFRFAGLRDLLTHRSECRASLRELALNRMAVGKSVPA